MPNGTNGTGECDGQPDPEPHYHPVPDQGYHQQAEKAKRQAILDGRSHPHPRSGGVEDDIVSVVEAGWLFDLCNHADFTYADKCSL